MPDRSGIHFVSIEIFALAPGDTKKRGAEEEERSEEVEKMKKQSSKRRKKQQEMTKLSTKLFATA